MGSNFHRVSRREPCPICGKADWCRTFEDGGVECMRVESPVSCTSGGWMHYPEGDWRDHITSTPVTTVVTDKIPSDFLNQAYKTLLSVCAPSVDHENMLAVRGLDSCRYGTLPHDMDDRCHIAREMARHVRIDGVPGFWRDSLGNPRLAGHGGLLVPIRNAQDQIIGMQIRKDEGDPRYSFLSSRGYPNGTGSGSPVHVRHGDFHQTAIITEGPLKADYVHHVGGQNVIAVPGVNNIRGVLPALRAMDLPKSVVAYDMDWKTNKQVKAARAKLMQILWCEGYGVSSLSWDPAYKGIDDALRVGCELIQTDYNPDGAIPCARIYEGGY